MSKTSLTGLTNDYCPQTLFLYGTYDDEGKADFGLFCWFSYIWNGELGVMACIGGNKLTKENIHKRKVFSANLVTEELLPLASPVNYELEVMQFIPLHDGEVMLCRIRNILQKDMLTEKAAGSAEKLAAIAPVSTTCQTYFSWKGETLGAWGEPMAKVKKPV